MASYQSRHDRKINVLIVITGLHIGGAEVVVRDLVRAIDRHRFNVSICCLKVLGSIGEELAQEGIDIVTLPQPVDGKIDYLTFLKLRRVILARQIDIVHTHTTHAMVDACLCKLTLPRLKVVHTFHFGNYPHQERNILWMEAISARVVDRLVAVSEVQRRQIQSVFRLRDRRISTVWNGVHRVEGNGDPTLRRQAGGDDIVFVGTLANLIEQKGLSDLLQVARRLQDTHPNVRFMIAGEGPLRPELERLQRELGLENTVVFAGWLSNAASRVLPTVDIYFQPSLWEAMSIAILEAMAAGKPVIATRVGEAPFMISDGEDGVLVEPRDVEGMECAIAKLVDDPGLRHRLGKAAARKAAEKFSVDRMTRAYEEIYLDMMGQARGN